jgi:hypothetical protein
MKQIKTRSKKQGGQGLSLPVPARGGSDLAPHDAVSHTDREVSSCVSPDAPTSSVIDPGGIDSNDAAAIWLKEHGVSQRDDARVDLIRIGGAGKRATSITHEDHNSGEEYQLEIPEPQPELRVEVDWPAIGKLARLTRVEYRALVHHFRHGTPVKQLHIPLRCRRVDANRTYREMTRKISLAPRDAIAATLNLQPVDNSLRPLHTERLHSGERPYSLGRMDPKFESVMGEEKYKWLLSDRVADEYRTDVPRISLRIGRLIMFASIDITTEQLREEVLLMTPTPTPDAILVERAKDILIARRQREIEAAEHARIDSMSDAGLATELKAVETELPTVESKIVAKQKELNKEHTNRDKEGERNPSVRSIAKFLSSRVPALEVELEDLIIKRRELSWLLPVLRDQVKYRAYLYSQKKGKTMASSLLKIINSAVDQIATTHPDAGSMPVNSLFPEVENCIDQGERHKLIAVLSAMLALNDYRKWRETVAKSSDVA